MFNPYFPSIKEKPVKTGLYTPSLPFGWNTFTEWINPQKKAVSHVEKNKSKTIKKGFSISAKVAKKVITAERLPQTSTVNLKPYLKLSVLCLVLLSGIFFYVKKSK